MRGLDQQAILYQKILTEEFVQLIHACWFQSSDVVVGQLAEMSLSRE